MQYILTQEEYDKLLKKGKDLEQKTIDDLQKLCTMVADHMPIKNSWMEDDEPMEPWRCILTVEEVYEHLCDGCPVQKLCPYKYKNYSK
jgi:hypothetical protein